MEIVDREVAESQRKLNYLNSYAPECLLYFEDANDNWRNRAVSQEIINNNDLLMKELNQADLDQAEQDIEMLVAFKDMVCSEHPSPKDQIDYALFTVRRAMNEAFDRL